MTQVFDRLLWSYRAVFKQTDGGGGTILVIMTFKERTVLLYGGIGPNDYAANRTVKGQILDSDDNVLGTILSNAAVDNKGFPFPVSDHSVVAASDGCEFEKQVVLGMGDQLVFTATGIVLNEELTVALRAMVSSARPFVETTGSGGTVTTTVTYDEVI